MLAIPNLQVWWRRQRLPKTGGPAVEGATRGEEAAYRAAAARVLQAGARRWLVWRRKAAPAWSQLLAPRLITEERRRQLQLEIQLWQQSHRVS